MSGELEELAAAAADVLVAALGRDSWQDAKLWFSEVIGHEGRLAATHAELASAGDGSARDSVIQAQVRAWTVRLRDVFEDDPAAAGTLQDLIAGMRAQGLLKPAAVMSAAMPPQSQQEPVATPPTAPAPTSEAPQPTQPAPAATATPAPAAPRQLPDDFAPPGARSRMSRPAPPWLAAAAAVVLLAAVALTGWLAHWPPALFGTTAAQGTPTATGNGTSASVAQPLTALRWTAETVAGLGGASDAELSAAACPSGGSCVVAGKDSDGALVATVTGNEWQPGSVASSDGYDSLELDSAACPAADSCVAAGNSSGGAVLVADSSGSWEVSSQLPAPPADAGSQPLRTISGLDCPATRDCVAADDYNSLDASGTEQETATLDTLDNGTWTAAAAPLPSDAASPGTVDLEYLSDVSCPAPNWCVAVGRYHRVDGAYVGMIETLANGTWSATAASGTGWLYAVGCPIVGSCVAVGGSSIETLADGAWSAAPAPFPANASTSDSLSLYGVACPAAGACVAVGSSSSANGDTGHPVVETLSNGHWSPAEAPLPANAGNNAGLDRVACTTTGTCVATGFYGSSQENFLETASR